ncbi:hypothetical protein AQ837_16435 [Burkholderia pseudomallei]|nr:hypothetical protein BURPS406E_J0283 [Burkholderia pseudomallei 406e]OMR86053.1 hypothetical protein AQ730_20275 [Burkholderia pseudomallei]OMS85135.1 hypothetical protein AQ748_16445 [Burkholderia pseudomallei]OMT53613.1 hypothetical protein AQ760_20780 [Burkholderia pseudomallei]OMU94756.1 hypothetical protein AQ784_16225 [Burkholderia pseudomallei]
MRRRAGAQARAPRRRDAAIGYAKYPGAVAARSRVWRCAPRGRIVAKRCRIACGSHARVASIFRMAIHSGEAKHIARMQARDVQTRAQRHRRSFAFAHPGGGTNRRRRRTHGIGT